ncbi:DNA alkylation repair protein [Streptomyces sp. NPDC020490]|uniref:DNA alkylation repair protein n=1 Tax=Streptomyces sp. NPDC020490 TaxID=3365078 RepID=UPI0037B079F7
MSTTLTPEDLAMSLKSPQRLADLLIAELRRHADPASAERARTVMPGVNDVMGTPMNAVTALVGLLARIGKAQPDEVNAGLDLLWGSGILEPRQLAGKVLERLGRYHPEPGQVSGDAFRLLAGLLLLFPTKARKQRFERNTRRRRKVPIDGWHMDFIADPPTPIPAPSGARRRRTAEESTCPQPQLVAKISRAEYPAEPADELGPAAALYTAVCRSCGGPYNRPWRRVLPGNRGGGQTAKAT